MRLMVRGFTAALIAGLLPEPAAAMQLVEKTRAICAEQTARVERSGGIPRRLLWAIALAESGRWDEDRRASFAWPWTVTAEGEGRFYASKGEAVAAVKALMARDVTNIDVGCMQINLYYHGGAFRNPEEALDPGTNVAYAARFLKGLFGAARSWPTAAAHYHSTNPEKNTPYRKKVMRLWNEERRQAAGVQRAAATKPAATDRPVVAIDWTRTAALNARFKASHAADSRPGNHTVMPAPKPSAGAATGPRRQVSGGAGALKAVAAAAAGRSKMKMRMGSRKGDDRGTDFTTRRQAQLEAWRRNGIWRGIF